MTRRNPLRSWLAATLSVLVVVALGLLTVRPVPAGAAERRIFEIIVTDAGFNPNVIPDANVNDVLMFTLDQTTDQHTVTFDNDSVCPGDAGAEPCWPDLHFDDRHPNCMAGNIRLPGRRCLLVMEPGTTARYHDAFNAANTGEVRVLGQATTTTSAPPTTTTTAPPTTTTSGPTTSTTQPPTTATTGPMTTTTTAPQQVRPFVISDPPSTTSTMAPPVSVSTNDVTPAPTTANKGKARDGDKAKSKAAGTETPTTVTPVAPDALPPGTAFDPSSLTPSPEAMPGVPVAPGPDDVNLESSAIMNLLDDVAEEEGESTDWGPLLLALGGLALVLSIGGICIWFGRASRFDPS
ncbi:MAG TPA: hypothetical protein VFF24_09405 [Acidimicrobiia bacterium]|nr:hypothetical protein [Acidimicrobiia bacterium]